MSENKLPRISLKSIRQDIMNILNLDRGVFYTLWGMLVRPKHIVDEYLNNDRRRGGHPLRFLILSSALAAFVSFQVYIQNPVDGMGFEESFRIGAELSQKDKADKEASEAGTTGEAKEQEAEGEKETSEEIGSPVQITMGDTDLEKLGMSKAEFLELISEGFRDYFQTFTYAVSLLSVPFYALLTWLFFRKRKLNYAEHLVGNAYVVAVNNVIGILTTLLVLVSPMIGIFSGILGAIYMIYAFTAIYSDRNFGSVVKSFLSVLLGGILPVIITSIAVIVYVFSLLKQS